MHSAAVSSSVNLFDVMSSLCSVQMIRGLKDVIIGMKAGGNLDISFVPVPSIVHFFSYNDVNLDGLTLWF